jgi:hypothetical protein
MSNSTIIGASLTEEEKNRVYNVIANLNNEPIPPKWGDLIEIKEPYKSTLSPRYSYRYKLTEDGVMTLIYRLKPQSDKIKLAGIGYKNSIYVTHPYYSIDGNTKKTNICHSAPVSSHPQMDRWSDEYHEEQQKRFPELIGKIAFDIKEQCYNVSEDICGTTGPCCCFILFEIIPQLPTMTSVVSSHVYNKIDDALAKVVNGTKPPKLKTEGGTKRRKGTKRKNAKRRKKTTIKRSKRVKH